MREYPISLKFGQGSHSYQQRMPPHLFTLTESDRDKGKEHGDARASKAVWQGRCPPKRSRPRAHQASLRRVCGPCPPSTSRPHSRHAAIVAKPAGQPEQGLEGRPPPNLKLDAYDRGIKPHHQIASHRARTDPGVNTSVGRSITWSRAAS